MRNKVGIGFWRRPEKAMRKFAKVHYCSIPVIVIIAVALIPQFAHAFGSSNRRPPPPPQQGERQLSPGPGPNNRPGPPPPHHQSIRRQGLPFEGGPPQRGEQNGNRENSNNNNNNNPPLGHRRIQSHHGPPPPPHGKHRGRPPPPFPFPRRRPPPPPPRGRGPPPRGDRDREQEPPRDGPRGRPPFKQPPNTPPETPSKLSFHIPPAPLTTPSPPHQQDGFQQRPPHQQQHQDGFQQRPPHPNGPQGAESQQNFQQFQQNQHQNQQQAPQFHQQLQQQQHHFQQQNSQFPPLNNNGNQFQNQPPQFLNQQQQQQQFPQNQLGPQQPHPGFPQGPNSFQEGPSVGPPNGFQQHQQGPPTVGPPNGFTQGPSAGPPHGFPQVPTGIPPTQFQPSGIPPTLEFQQHLQHHQQGPPQQGFPLNNLPQPAGPSMNPSHIPPFNDPNQQIPTFQEQQPVFGQINPPSPSGPPPHHHHHMQHQNNPSNPPILEYAPPPNTFQSTPQPDLNLLQDKSKEIELNSIPKQTITFTVTPKPSKAGGTQLHFKISTPKPFKTTLKPLTNSKGYFKGSTYRPPVDKLNSKFKYTSSNAGYPDAEYKPQDGIRRESSMSAEMMPPNERPRNSIKDLLLNRDHSLNTPTGPHLDDTDNYAGPSYEAPPIYVKPISGEQVLIAGVSGGKTSYYKNHHPDDLPFHGPSSGPPFPDEDYDNGPIGIPHHNRNPFVGDDEDIGSKSYADRHLHSNKDPSSFDEFSTGKLHEDTYRRPSHSGSHEGGVFDDFEHGRKSRPRPSLHSHSREEPHSGSGESKRGGNRHGVKFSQPDPLYHPEEDGGSSVSKERERDNGEEVGDRDRFEGFGFGGGSGERRHKDKDYRKDSSKNTAEELLAALGLSTNPLISMPDSKYPVDIPGKYTLPGSWEKDYNPSDPDHKRSKNKEEGGPRGGGGEPLGLLEYLNQKKEEEGEQSDQNNEPLFAVPDRPVGSGENSYVVKGSMKTGASGSGEKSDSDAGKSASSNVVVGRPIPQYQGSESDIIAKQTSYVEHKIKGHGHTYAASNPGSGQESYLYEKIHGANTKPHLHLDSDPHVPVINSGLYGPSVPPPLSEPGTFTNSPPILSSPAPIEPLLPHVGPSGASLLAHHQSVLHSAPSAPGSESYLYEKIHGSKPAAGLAFGPTPPAAHSVEDLSNSGLYNTQHLNLQTGLYASASEQVASASGPATPTGLVYTHGKVVNPQQPQPQSTVGNTLNGVLLPLGMGGNQQPATGLIATNTIPVQAPQQKFVSSPQYHLGQQQQQQHVPQQPLIAVPTAQQPTVPMSQQPLQTQQQHHLIPQQQLPVQTQQPQPIHTVPQPSPQQIGSLYQSPVQVAQQQLQQPQHQQQQPLQGQHSQQVAHVVPPPTQQQPQQQLGNLYGVTGNGEIDRSAQVAHQHYSGEVGLQQPSQHQQQGLLPQASQTQYQQQQPSSYLHQHIHGQQQLQAHLPGNPYAQQPVYPTQPQYNQYAQQSHQDPTSHAAASNLQHQHALPHQPYAAGSAVTPRYGEPYPVYVTEPDPIIEIIVQDSNMTLPSMPTLPPPPPPPPPTPEPVHVFYVKYSQKNNTPTFDNYYGQSSPQIQLEQPISSVPVRGPDRNGMLAVDDTQDSLPQSSVQHQSIYNNVYATSTEASVSTTPPPGQTTTLRTIIRPDRNELAHTNNNGLVVSFDNPAVEHEIFANYTNNYMQQQQQLQQQYQQQQQPQQQQNEQNIPQDQPQQQGHAYPDVTFTQQAYQQYAQQQQQQQQYPSLDSLWGGLTSEQKSVMEQQQQLLQQQQQQQQQQESQNAYQGFNKRIGLQELASLLESTPPGGDDQQKPPEHINANINLQDYHSMHQNPYSMNTDDQNPPPLYQYVESQPSHQSVINTRQAKLPDDVPEELRNQLVQSGILGNADVQVINYSENLFKELGELPPEAMAAFQAHTGNTGQNKQLDSEANASPSSLEQSVWSGSQVSLANADLSTLLPSGRSLRSILVVKNSLRPKRGGRQRRVVLLITDKDDVLLYRPKDRSLKRIGDTTSNSVIRGAIELSNHRMDDEESVAAEEHDHHQRASA